MMLQGTYTGTTVPTTVSVAFDGAAAAALTTFNASGGRWTGRAIAPAKANFHTTVASGTGFTAGTAPGTFASTSGAVVMRAQFIPGTTGFANTLDAYTGSSNGDLGNAWTSTADGNVPAGNKVPAVNPSGSGVGHGPLVQGAYYHNLTNVGTLPSKSSGWVMEMSDITIAASSIAGTTMALHIHSDNTNDNCFGCSFGSNGNGQVYASFYNQVGNHGTPVAAQTTGGTWPPTMPFTVKMINDGTNVSLTLAGQVIGSVPTSSINDSGGSNAGWTAFTSDASNPLYYSFTSFSVGPV